MENHFVIFGKSAVFCLLLGVWLERIQKGETLSCRVCVSVNCVTPTNCAGGTTLGICQCCQICAKQLGEPCGGSWNRLGKCDKGLVCSSSNSFQPGTCTSSSPPIPRTTTTTTRPTTVFTTTAGATTSTSSDQAALRYKNLGCWKDTGIRAIPTLEGDPILGRGSYWTRRNAIEKCARAANQRGYIIFAVQNGGWCASSATADGTYQTYGASTACKADGKGGPWANQVYQIEIPATRSSITTGPPTVTVAITDTTTPTFSGSSFSASVKWKTISRPATVSTGENDTTSSVSGSSSSTPERPVTTAMPHIDSRNKFFSTASAASRNGKNCIIIIFSTLLLAYCGNFFH